jgi:hypothetical protein
MSTVFRTLEDITTGYTVFEKDQVLTEQQLNGLVTYLDDANRLTRTISIGVGISCGLRVRFERERVLLTRGAGVTTDGDLFHEPADVSFTRFKPWDDSAPEYEPFRPGGHVLPAWELIPAGVKDEKAIRLVEFPQTTHRAPEDMVAVLFMESVEKDDDLCSGTDCDNRGKHVHHTRRLLLFEKASLRRLLENLDVPRRAAKALEPVVAARTLLTAATDTPATLAAAYRATCTSINAEVGAQLERVIAACGPLLADAFPSDPTATWKALLAKHAAAFAGGAPGIQYYYDFLKDLVDTWNEFYGLLREDSTLCSPPLLAFPKHLVLGDLVRGPDPEEHRTGWYPSPMVSATLRHRRHARFLALKLNAMLHDFRVPPVQAAPLRITPSHFEDAPLEDRAIPWYYDPLGTFPIHGAWSWRLTRRRLATWNYGYFADVWQAEGGAADPLGTQIGRYSFFRIEGHIGKPVTDAVRLIEGEIASRNLPFTVRTTVLSKDRERVVLRPPRYTDLNKFRYLVEGATVNHLDDIQSFTEGLAGAVNRAVDAKVLTSTATTDVPTVVKHITAEKKDAAIAKADRARVKLAASDPTWDEDAADAAKAVAEMRYNLGDFATMDSLAPAQTLLASPFLPWLKWIDDIIVATDEAEDKRLLFENFIREHPGIEHFGGVTRGGTFVIIYDAGGRVVGDVMLPYHAPAPPPVKPVEPPLVVKPGVRIPWDIPDRIRVTPNIPRLIDDSIRFQVGDKLNDLTKKLDHTSTMVDVYQKFAVPGQEVVNPSRTMTDEFLNVKVKEMNARTRTLEALRTRAIEPGLDAAGRKEIEGQVKEAEAGLAASINETTKYVAESGADVTKGSDGLTALSIAAESSGRLGDAKARKAVKDSLTGLQGSAKPELRNVIKAILRRPGF